MNKQFLLLIFLASMLINCSTNDDSTGGSTGGNLNITPQFDILNVINGKEIRSSIKTNDGGFVAIAFGDDYDIIKFDSDFNIVWNKTYGGSEADHAEAIIQTNDGGLLVIGWSNSTDGDISQSHGAFDIWICKLDIDGTLLWEKSYGGSQNDSMGKENSLLQDDDGNYFFIGFTKSNDHDVSINYGGYDIWLVKINANGDILFEKTYGGFNDDYGRKIIQNNDKYNLLIKTNSVEGDFDEPGNWIVQLDQAGNIDWKTNLFEINSGSIGITQNGEIIAINTDLSNFILSKLNTDGNVTLTKTINFQSISNKQPFATKVIETNDNGFIIIGDIGSGNDQDAILFRVSSSFDQVYTKTYAGNDYDKSASLITIDNNDFIYQIITGSRDLDGINQSGGVTSVFVDLTETLE